MSIVRRMMEILAERAVALVGSLFASRLESIVALEDIEHHNAMEERARELEQQGKPQLAAALRARAAQISPDALAAHGLCVLRRLEQEEKESPTLLLTGQHERTESSTPADQPSDTLPVCRPEPRRLRRPQVSP